MSRIECPSIQTKTLMNTNRPLNRRLFLKGTAGTAALLGVAPSLIPARLLGEDAPSNKITAGFIGVGDHGTGWNLSLLSEGTRRPRCIAVCDVDATGAMRAKETVDERYGNQDCATTKDFREVLARQDIDAVMISTPDHWHTLISVMAARAGKDVQCEKPTLTIGEGKILIETMRKLGKVFQTSTEDRSLPMYHRMAELVRNGRIGKLQKIEVILPRQPTVPGDPTPQPVPAKGWITRCGSARRPSLPIPKTGSFQLPLDLGLLRRDHLRLGRAPVRHRAMGQ